MEYSIESAEILEEIMNRGMSNMDEVDSILINFSEEEKKEKEAFKENRKILDDLNDYLYSGLNSITKAKDVLQTTFHTAFEPLSLNEWIDRLLEDLELSEFDFSEFSDISFVDDMLNRYENNKTILQNIDEAKTNVDDRLSVIQEKIDKLCEKYDQLDPDKVIDFLARLEAAGFNLDDVLDFLMLMYDKGESALIVMLITADAATKVSEAYEVTIITVEYYYNLYLIGKNGYLNYDRMQTLFNDVCTLAIGELGEVIGRGISLLWGGAGGTLTAQLGDMIASKVTEKGPEYVFEHLFSKGGDDRLRIDYEVSEFFNDLINDTFTDRNDALDEFGDILND